MLTFSCLPWKQCGRQKNVKLPIFTTIHLVDTCWHKSCNATKEHKEDHHHCSKSTTIWRRQETQNRKDYNSMLVSKKCHISPTTCLESKQPWRQAVHHFQPRLTTTWILQEHGKRHHVRVSSHSLLEHLPTVGFNKKAKRHKYKRTWASTAL